MGLLDKDDGDLPPAARLEGLKLPSGWSIASRVERLDGQTGSFFSIGYMAKNDKDGGLAFLKALDFSQILQEENLLEAIEGAVNAFRFEQDLLEVCASKRMTRIVRALDSGYIRVDDSQLGRVPYLLFEPADGDIRKVLISFGEVELVWALTILHQVALGLEQLHYAQVAHQDLKPSNVLAFDGSQSFKISDLGCASRKGMTCPRDGKKVAGGWSVAPPELMYGEKHQDWVIARVSADLYALGSLATFLFTGASMNAIVKGHIPEEFDYLTWRGTYKEVLPFLVEAYSSSFEEMSQSFVGEIQEAVLDLIKQLCDPDPLRRGDVRNIGVANQQYDVRRFVSRFAALKKRAEYKERVVVR